MSEKKPRPADMLYGGAKVEPEFVPRVDDQGWQQMRGGGWWKPAPGGWLVPKTGPTGPQRPADRFYGKKSDG